jgi:hypothetical protein
VCTWLSSPQPLPGLESDGGGDGEPPLGGVGLDTGGDETSVGGGAPGVDADTDGVDDGDSAGAVCADGAATTTVVGGGGDGCGLGGAGVVTGLGLGVGVGAARCSGADEDGAATVGCEGVCGW